MIPQQLGLLRDADDAVIVSRPSCFERFPLTLGPKRVKRKINEESGLSSFISIIQSVSSTCHSAPLPKSPYDRSHGDDR